MEFDANGIEAANAKVKEFGGTIKVTDGMIEKSGGGLSKLSLKITSEIRAISGSNLDETSFLISSQLS